MKKISDILNEKYILNIEVLKKNIFESIDDSNITDTGLKKVKRK